MNGRDPNTLAMEYLLATRMGSDAAGELAERLAVLSGPELRDGLADDPAKIAFWTDLYNAEVIRAGAVDLRVRRTRLLHFRRSSLVVAGHRISLDAIEHGLLRRSSWKLGLGYVGNPLPGAFERAHRVERVDPRVHFVLNCGATSCPPIAAYDRARITEQLELATTSYLRAEVQVDGDVLRVPMVMLWYLGDFGGFGGVRRLLRSVGIDDTDRAIRFRTWDWTPAPDDWSGDSR